jgi:hypothetical protein
MHIGMERGIGKTKPGSSRKKYRGSFTMRKHINILIAAVVATLTPGAATFAGTAKTGYTCRKPDRVYCQERQTWYVSKLTIIHHQQGEIGTRRPRLAADTLFQRAGIIFDYLARDFTDRDYKR